MSNYVLQHLKCYNFGEVSAACDCPLSICSHLITDRQRANHLLDFTDDLRNAGWGNVRFMPLRADKRGPIIRGTAELDSCKLDSDEARSRLVTPEEAARRIREDSARGFFLYCDREDHGTEGLVILDRDEPDQWPDTPDTLRVVSGGEGESDHLYYRNDGSVERSKASGDKSGAGSVQAKNWGVVVPGSIHHESDGIYHLAANLGVSTLASSDLTDPFLPSGGTAGSGEHTYDHPENPDEDAVETVQEAIVNFRCHGDKSRRAVDYLTDLQQGKNLRKHGFIPADSDNQGGCRHEANLALASKLYGILLMNGEVDDDRNHWLITEFLGHLARKYPKTSCGQPRKLRISRRYIEGVVSEAISTFRHTAFIKWRRKQYKDTRRWNGEYSETTKEMVMTAVETLCRTEEEYPTKADVVDFCQVIDASRSETTHRKALSRLVGEEIRMAHCGGNDYRYYPMEMDDPEEAVSVKPTRSECGGAEVGWQ